MPAWAAVGDLTSLEYLNTIVIERARAKSGIGQVIPGTDRIVLMVVGKIHAGIDLKQIKVSAVRGLNMKFRELKLRRDPACTGACSKIKGLIDYHQFCGMPNPHKDELVGPRSAISQASSRSLCAVSCAACPELVEGVRKRSQARVRRPRGR